MKRIDFNAMHAPIGAHSTFTLGCFGRNGGLGLELGGPANDQIYIGVTDESSRVVGLFPFCDPLAPGDEALRYAEGEARGKSFKSRFFTAKSIERNFDLSVDQWTAGDLCFSIYSPVVSAPDPDRASKAELMRAYRPSVTVELTLDNRKRKTSRRLVFGYAPDGGQDAVRRIQTSGRVAGVGQGRSTAILTDHPNAVSATGFTLTDILDETHPFNYGFALGPTGAILVDVPAGKKVSVRLAICFFRDGLATTGLDTRYLYTRYFKDIESVGSYSLKHFDVLRKAAIASSRLVNAPHLNEHQRFQLIHAIRSYYGSTQLLDHDGQPLWVVNEGEYRMLNTFDLTVDQLFYEMKMNPWAVRNVLDLFVSRYSYTDRLHFPGGENDHAGGISFTHDMGQKNHFSPAGRSSYEKEGLTGCFSHMTHEQLLNWVLCASTYTKMGKDRKWLKQRLPIFKKCLRSMLNRDSPRSKQRNGIMGLDSSRTGLGAEITTYDSLDESLGQARNNGYMAVKGWAAYVLLADLFRNAKLDSEADTAASQAARAASTIVRFAKDGELPALLGEATDSRIIPVVEGLVFPWVTNNHDALADDGPYGGLIRTLRQHIKQVLRKGICLYDDGAWKLSSTADNSWLSKIYLSQFVVREILGIRSAKTGKTADRAHANWLLADENVRWAWSDQMRSGIAKGSLYYPRGVTSILWLEESV